MTKVKCLIYARVSSATGRQNEERQVVELTNYANHMGYTIVDTLIDRCSGSNDERENLNRIIKLAEDNAYDKLLLSEISRLSRKTSKTIEISERLTTLKKSIFLLNYNLETLDKDLRPNPVANIILMVLGEMANMEKTTLQSRILSSLELCRAKGIKLGRRVGSLKSKEKFFVENKGIFRLLKQGLSYRNIAQLQNCSVNTVVKAKRYMLATQ